MARIPRRLKIISGFALHQSWRGHNREPNIAADHEKLKYLEFLNKDLEDLRFEKGANLHALTLMTNHVHQISTPTTPELYSDHMRRHHSRYGMFFNKLKNRCGKVAQDRPHTTLLGDAHHQMIATFYVDANPLRANMVKDARNYRWSTHRYYAYGIWEDWMRNITLPGWYLLLGHTMAQRQKKYRKLFAAYLKATGIFRQSFLKKMFYGPLHWESHLEEGVSSWRKRHAAPDG